MLFSSPFTLNNQNCRSVIRSSMNCHSFVGPGWRYDLKRSTDSLAPVTQALRFSLDLQPALLPSEVSGRSFSL
jgi:hypothetical protein